jgi:hypothetical protein
MSVLGTDSIFCALVSTLCYAYDMGLVDVERGQPRYRVNP